MVEFNVGFKWRHLYKKTKLTLPIVSCSVKNIVSVEIKLNFRKVIWDVRPELFLLPLAAILCHLLNLLSTSGRWDRYYENTPLTKGKLTKRIKNVRSAATQGLESIVYTVSRSKRTKLLLSIHIMLLYN